MPLKLTITSYQRLSPGQEIAKTLGREPLTIGRAAQNDWVLQDPERILSKHHCTVLYREGAYFLTDFSVNGTFLNDSQQRIARNQTIELNDGDHFVLGEYEISVAFDSGEPDSKALLEGPFTDIVPPFDSDLLGGAPPLAADPLQHGGGDAWLDHLKPPFDDILSGDRGGPDPARHAAPAASDRPATTPSPDLSSPERINFELPSLITGAGLRKSLAPTTEPPSEPLFSATPTLPEPGLAVQPAPASTALPATSSSAPEAAPKTPLEPELQIPEPAPMTPLVPEPKMPTASVESGFDPLIPDDWWMQPAPPSAAAPVAPVAPQPISQVPAKQIPTSPVAPVSQRPSAGPAQPALAAASGADVLLRAFCEGAGLPLLKLADAQTTELMANLGAIFRETVRGLMEVLLARSDVKGEFRLDRTTMGPIENNPLKTSPGQPPLAPEQVMGLLLLGQKDAYMPPVQAVREGFDDIKAHQLAVMAGIQAALNHLLQRFDPGNLEDRLEQNVLDNLWPANRKAKYWDLFIAEYHAIAREAEDDFNKLFGEEFARAYQSRLRDA
ncbi:MAG: type VI secretion system-associated FHA domain protein TagH [Candidatus Competibacteraceae bacterium]|nr:type VI secretion system-associated FHA domain protein TagH [Candidatus Competibacteraceae bacterium]MBK8963234.1 type VI secretion system-associated FHA domain protein TagH [Candidatus Competibacteraceae bacterium]MBK9952198.1 type VI secretion system-associated FHA domain protein TagH [Candidatus Competibacteraceae bacterium]